MPRDGGLTGGSVSTGAFVKLFCDASRALVKYAVGFLKLWNATDVLVGIVQVGVATMIESLMP